MKKWFSLIACAICGFCVAENSGIATDASLLDPRIIKVIEDCDSIQWMLLDPIATDSIGRNFAIVGEALSVVSDTNEDRIGALKSTLLYSKSFEIKNLKKDCTFLPDIALIAYNKGEEIVFAYSFYCDVCRFECDSIKEEYDGELIRDAILQMSLEVFPKDRYLRKIAGMTR